MSLNESGEMYLETIYILHQKNSHVRSLDIAEYMGYSKPSISRAVGLLKKANYILVDSDGYITLTKAGNDIASKIYDRHTTLTKALMLLGIDEKTATEDACKIEHDISEKSFMAIKQHISKYSL
ncbi:MAG: metal-dependent transcriptional regulator [Erysipelotrichales bacterium]|nr:metal-dependent transcriptional regulator [Erysipelotrichales bacterium]